jgi:hypothetical protein
MPIEISNLLSGYYSCKTRADATRWEHDVVQAIIEKADLLNNQTSSFGGPRAYCPLCRCGSQGPFDEGFAVPEGLRRHLFGWGNSHRCRVTEAAFALARDHWKTTVDEAERQQHIADAEEVLRRKKIEILFRVDPYKDPELIEEGCHFDDKPRTEEELQWAEDRLRHLGFEVLMDERVKTYTKEYDAWVVYADPRFQKKISFCVHRKPESKRRRPSSPCDSFFLMDSWKNDLHEKFEYRFRAVVPPG